MQFEFFTMGGSQLWEDVFFYQKWRIQRNYRTKEYRLLDPWDIQRHSGGFENCRRAFLDYIEIYEISRQRGHMVIMLHGLGDSKNIFKPLWRAVLKEGLMAAAINYPSTRKRIDSHVRQLEFLLNNLEDVQEVSFVTKGVGGIILRKLMAIESPWQKKLKIRRIVQVCPPNQGSKLFAWLEKYSFFRWLLGPMLKEVSPQNMLFIPNFPKGTEFGVISTDFAGKNLLKYVSQSFQKALPTPRESDIEGAKDTIYIGNASFNVFNNPKIVQACVRFLTKGKFD